VTRGWRGLGRTALGMLVAAGALFPIYFMLVQSVKTPQEDVAGNPLIVRAPTLDNFRELLGEERCAPGIIGAALLRRYPFVGWLENTLLVFAGSVGLTLGLGLSAGYALGWLRPPGWRWWRRGLFATYAIPQTILFVPLYEIVIRLGLDNSLVALLLTYPPLALPFCVWLLSAYWERVPRALEEAARVDGASPAAVFFRILLPLATPVIVAAGVFTLGTVASDFMLASVFLSDPRAQTIPAGVGTMDVSLEELTAVAAINVLAIPIAFLCAVFVRSYVRGLTAALAEGA
jgi:multiple sugar transport system permease protein